MKVQIMASTCTRVVYLLNNFPSLEERHRAVDYLREDGYQDIRIIELDKLQKHKKSGIKIAGHSSNQEFDINFETIGKY